ncbi:hypothetical protein [Hymenobacter lapidiphilus]|uniref:Uncharacterized protein n=1 Tax=Hymenobacter lapidiphilus TaxID=2608003 RepID=A0A7Y7PN05_9BACT|nr:hypothetical protein [Hymenobacter lapidiphilus]NVO30788.1 hypothetical protein [Hymenobacter lapidiphilus]
MSRVTNLMIAFNSSEDSKGVIEQLRKFTYRNLPFNITSVKDEKLPESWYGGTKYLECNILLGAFNHFEIKPLVEYMRQMTWDSPECVQLIIKEEWDVRFRIVEVFPEEQ